MSDEQVRKIPLRFHILSIIPGGSLLSITENKQMEIQKSGSKNYKDRLKWACYLRAKFENVKSKI